MITSDDILKIIIPICAFIISVLALYVNFSNGRRQARISKLEEMLEIVDFLLLLYYPISTAKNFQDEIKNTVSNFEINQGMKKSFNEIVDSLKDRIGDKGLEKKCNRLSVLANSYLRDKDRKGTNVSLKLKLLGISEFFQILDVSIVYNNRIYRDIRFEEGLPDAERFAEYCDGVIEELIDEMDFGYKMIRRERVLEYTKSQFKIDVGILDPKNIND